MSLTLCADVDLTHKNTLGLKSAARLDATFDHPEDLFALVDIAQQDQLSVFPLGSGSNVLLEPWVEGIVLRSGNTGFKVEGNRVRAGAGLNWDALVQLTLAQDLYGLENLSAIPGTVGAAPIQNIGAYGVELSEMVVGVEVFDFANKKVCFFDREACQFGYRTSLFKEQWAGRYFVTEVVVELNRDFHPVLSYPDVARLPETAKNSGQSLRDSVVRIRGSKLPDHRVLGNVGSFFKNPIVTERIANDLVSKHFMAHAYGVDFKVSAAALIDASGLAGFQIGGARVSPHHTLVLENIGNATLSDISDLAMQVQREVLARFGVALEIEPQRLRGLTGEPANY